MSYYTRPMGDYKTYGYAGDPGWLSSIWKGIKKVALPVLGGVIGGIPGALISGGGGQKMPKQPGTAMTVPGTFGGAVGFPGGMSVQGSYVPGTIIPGQGRLPPFTATGPGVLPMGGRGGTCAPSGYHFAKDGSGRMVRNRRMNVANPKALRRSLRRVQGFEKLVRRTFTISGTVKPKKRRG